MKSFIYNQPQNKELYLYVDIYKNSQTGEFHTKVGKENIEESRHYDWSNKIESLKQEKKISPYWSVERVPFGDSLALPCWWYDEKRDCKFYMTTSKKLTGNDTDDIARDGLANHPGFVILHEKNGTMFPKYDIYLDGQFITDEGVDFGTDDTNEIINRILTVKEEWIEKCKESSEMYGSDFVRVDYNKVNSDKIEFKNAMSARRTKNQVKSYQEKGVEWIEERNRTTVGENYLVLMGCGGGKTSVSTYAVIDKAFETKKPVLLLSGLISPKFAYEDDFNTFLYKGKSARLLTIDEATKECINTCFESNTLPIIFVTCQASIDKDGEEITIEKSNISKILGKYLKRHIGISSILSDECHKIVFGNKCSKIIDEIRSYPENADANAFHFTGTGFSINQKFDRENLYDEITDKLIWESQGDFKVEKRHMLYSTNPNFIDSFYADMVNGWKYLLGGGSSEYDVDNMNSIYTFKNKIEKPVICAYLKNRETVRESYAILTNEYSYDNAVIISSNGCPGVKGDVYVINTPSGRPRIINKSIKSEIKREIRKAVAQGKLVILLNVNKFVESWTIPELNVQLYLRNISSADVFWQTIARGMRPNVENGHRIKSEVYVFLYGATFYTIMYKWYNEYLQRTKKISKKEDSVDKAKAMNDVFYNTMVHIDGTAYGEGELKDINDLRMDLIRIHKEKCYEEGIDSFINGIFRELYGNLFDNTDCSGLYSNLTCHKSMKVSGDALNKGRHKSTGGKSNGGNSSGEITGKDFYDHLKSYLTNLITHRLSTFMYREHIDYDELAEYAAINPLVKDEKEFMYNMWGKINSVTESSVDDIDVDIKGDIEKMIDKYTNIW